MSRTTTEFVEFLLKYEALKFGNFTLKSGRKSPYFFNLGVFNTGKSLQQLGAFYAQALLDSDFNYDVLFGPAYKGIPLVCSIVIALAQEHGVDAPYCFNRKEKKDHGDGGDLVGTPMKGHIVLFDDVITAGTTIREAIDIIKKNNALFSGIIIAFDRQEKGTSSLSAVEEITKTTGIPVKSILTLTDLLHYLDAHPEYPNGDQIKTDILSYNTPEGYCRVNASKYVQ